MFVTANEWHSFHRYWISFSPFKEFRCEMLIIFSLFNLLPNWHGMNDRMKWSRKRTMNYEQMKKKKKCREQKCKKYFCEAKWIMKQNEILFGLKTYFLWWWQTHSQNTQPGLNFLLWWAIYYFMRSKNDVLQQRRIFIT